MSHAPRPDPTNAVRQRRHRERRRAVRDALADPTEHAAAEAAPTSQVQVLTSQTNAVRRLEDAAARRAFTGVLEVNAEAVANVLVQKALEGDVGAAMAVASRLAPPAKQERRVHVPDLPPLTTPENCREAERLVGEAAAKGAIGLDDAMSLARLIAGVAEGQVYYALKKAALARMNARLENGGGLRMRLRELVVAAGTADAIDDEETRR